MSAAVFVVSAMTNAAMPLLSVTTALPMSAMGR